MGSTSKTRNIKTEQKIITKYCLKRRRRNKEGIVQESVSKGQSNPVIYIYCLGITFIDSKDVIDL